MTASQVTSQRKTTVSTIANSTYMFDIRFFALKYVQVLKILRSFDSHSNTMVYSQEILEGIMVLSSWKYFSMNLIVSIGKSVVSMVVL